MIKKILVTTLFSVICTTVSAEENVVLEDASVDYIKTVIETCKEYAIEDEVKAKDLNSYLLECVNDDLEGNDYNKLTALPK